MTDRTAGLRELVARARRLSPAERAGIATWATNEALWSERNLAMETAYREARKVGRYPALADAMDEAFGAVAQGAGFQRPIGYWDDDSGERPEWDAAATLAAQAAAALIVEDLVAPPLHDLLLDPWVRLSQA